jgi:exodeoxyribonuclease VII small subunit
MPLEIDPSPGPNFEDVLRRLEQIVDDLERGEPELASALAKYEQGVRLLAQCHAVLEKAERSVALLTGVDEAGNPLTSPFEATVTTEPEPAPNPQKPAAPRKRTPPRSAEGNDSLIPF